MNNRIENATNILNFAIKNDIGIAESCIENGYSSTYVKNAKIHILSKKSEDRIKEDRNFLTLHEEVLSRRIQKKRETVINSEKDLNIDEKYDQRSKFWYNRDKNDKIDTYGYEVLVRDELPFKGELTRTQMEMIYSYYPYVTQNTVSQFFPYLNFIQLKKILRVFNITKDKLFPPHLIEELSDEQLAELGLKNKENAAYKKFSDNKNKFYENELRKVQTKLFELDEDTKFYENIIDRTLDKYIEKLRNNFDNNIKPKEVRTEIDVTYESLYFCFGDIHFGKFFKDAIYGRGVDKHILKERCMAIAHDIVYQANLYKSKKIFINVLGDIFESILPDGMHPEHHKRMDLIGEQQLEFGLDVFEEMIDYIQLNTKYDNKIYMYCIGGNHDRIQEDRGQDKRRTASAIFYIMLRKIFKIKNYDNLVVYEPEDGIMRYADNGISFIGFHGDSQLFKSNPIDVINLFKVGDSKNYTVILNGHWHSVKIVEGVNYKKIICGSVCSVDEYIQNEIGKGSQPSYTVIKKSKGFGVDIEIKTLK